MFEDGYLCFNMNEAMIVKTDRVTPDELYELLAEDGRIELLDVRTPGEFAAAHVAGARLLPLDDLDAPAFLNNRPASEKPVYVICQTTRRARQAINKFQRAGFDRCVLVEGGMQGWMEVRLPVNRGISKALPLIRQVHVAVGLISGLGAVLALTVNPYFAFVPLFTSCGLLVAGLTGFCGLALLLAKMPWNRLGKAHANCACQPIR
jgi:rhodanese-related sulfurtransferase